MKLSEIDKTTVIEYIHPEDDEQLIEIIMAASKQFILSYMGLTEEKADLYEDLSIAYLVLCAEMYDNRRFTVDNEKLSPIVNQILASHSVNYL